MRRDINQAAILQPQNKQNPFAGVKQKRKVSQNQCEQLFDDLETENATTVRRRMESCGYYAE